MPAIALQKFPERPADDVIEDIKLLPYQNALYRLNGDKNLLHIDSEVAQKAGFKSPILHGLCTHGISARYVFERMACSNVS